MKINEIIVEARLDEIGTLKAIGGALSGLSGGIAGAKGGWAAGKAAGMEQDLVKRTVQKAMTSWGQQQQRLKMAKQTPTVQDATAWFAQFSRQQPTSTPAGIGPGQITPWLQKEIAAYMVKKNSAQPAAPDEQPVDQQPQRPEIEPVHTVITPTGQKAIQAADNKWYREDGTPVDNPADIKQLNQMVINARETARAKGNPVPAVITARTQRAANAAAQTATTDATVQQSAGTQQPAPTTATNGDIFAGDTQQPEAPLPDVSNLTPEERAQLVQQIKQQLGQQA